MSQRTVLEFNHDFLHQMETDPDFAKKLISKIKENDWSQGPRVPGVRKVGERHHSQDLVIEVNGLRTNAT